MDFITHLPKVCDFEAILVIIDRFSNYATFIPTTKQCSAEMTAQLFFKHVVKLWGVPTSILPPPDGRPDRAIQLHARGILAPFCKCKAKELGKNPQALNFTKEWKHTNDIARAYLEKASKQMEKWADKKRRPLEFREGDQVLIKLRPKQIRFRGRKDQRLIRKYEGLVELLKKVGNTSYRVTLPTWMKIYPVIHVSNLKSYHQDTQDLQRNVVTRPIIDLSQKEDKDVEEIMAERETSWERVEDLEAWKQKIEDFKLHQSTGTSTV
ncbi:reverse transcriptase [Cucumis melo var. makuwa]|uniref:Reverse transcriptase n=1 Tax=Cucumis melo var. makuwa TaxID=1194695 RepID=A0A5D3CI53_CUCMM|nr:reverse transcriptase [Cucumis melo var. makuwa]